MNLPLFWQSLPELASKGFMILGRCLAGKCTGQYPTTQLDIQAVEQISCIILTKTPVTHFVMVKK